MKTDEGGIIDITWTSEETGCPCGAVMWTAHFSVDEPIVLESNHMPEVCIPGCDVNPEGPADLGKWVWACVCTQWTGCDQPDQQFSVMGSIEGFDVEAGKICLCDYYFPDTLPICITNEWLEDKYLDLCVYGGYDFVEGAMELIQTKTGLDGELIMHAETFTTDCPCGAECVHITFSVEEPIVFDSNHLPVIDIPGFYASGLSDGDLDKWVSLFANMKWAGCGDEDQQFMLISAHKVMSRNPNFRVLYIHHRQF
jgi:hypothetical protein